MDGGPVLLRATDAGGRQVLCMYRRGSGPRRATVYEDESLRRVRFLIEDGAPDRHRFLEDLGRERRPLRDLARPDLADPVGEARASSAPSHVISGPAGERLGRLASSASAWDVVWRGAYNVQDAAGNDVGRIFRDNPLRLARRVELRGANVLRLRGFLRDSARGPSRGAFELEKISDLPPWDEGLVLASVVAVILDDWWRVHARWRGA